MLTANEAQPGVRVRILRPYHRRAAAPDTGTITQRTRSMKAVRVRRDGTRSNGALFELNELECLKGKEDTDAKH